MTRRPVAVLFLIAVTTVTCGKRDEAAPAEPLTLSVTHWTDATELFMEYPPLVTGHSARFAVHVTTLKDFKALSAGGQVRVPLTKTFFSSNFGMVADHFGVSWMVLVQ